MLNLEQRAGATKQGTPEWYAARCGKITASCFGKVMTPGRSKTATWGQTAISYMYEVLGERLTGKPADIINSKYLEWGHVHEPTARSLYGWVRGKVIQLVPFVVHPTLPNVGGSPDGYVGEDGLAEIKCPFTARNHLETIHANEIVDKDYQWQCQGNLWVTGRKWLDFISFHPDFPEELQIHVIRVERDEDMIQELADRVERFDQQIEGKLAKIRKNIVHGTITSEVPAEQ